MKINTVHAITMKHAGLRAGAVATDEQIKDAVIDARKRGVLIASDGRCYAPWVRNVPGKRWHKGVLVARDFKVA